MDLGVPRRPQAYPAAPWTRSNDEDLDHLMHLGAPMHPTRYSKAPPDRSNDEDTSHLKNRRVKRVSKKIPAGDQRRPMAIKGTNEEAPRVSKVSGCPKPTQPANKENTTVYGTSRRRELKRESVQSPLAGPTPKNNDTRTTKTCIDKSNYPENCRGHETHRRFGR